MSRVDEIRGRLAKATPGEWEAVPGAMGWRVLAKDERATIVCDVSGALSNPESTGDADLIANAPADLAHLLTLLAEAEAVILNERGEGEPPSVGWAWRDGAWRKDPHCIVMRGTGDTLWSEHNPVTGWRWREIPTARAAMKQADLSLATPTEPPK